MHNYFGLLFLQKCISITLSTRCPVAALATSRATPSPSPHSKGGALPHPPPKPAPMKVGEHFSTEDTIGTFYLMETFLFLNFFAKLFFHLPCICNIKQDLILLTKFVLYYRKNYFKYKNNNSTLYYSIK